MVKLKSAIFALPAALATLLATPFQAQSTATVHGHVNDATGMAVSNANVKLTTDKTSPAQSRQYPYSSSTDANGDYTAARIPPGNYLVVVEKNGVNEDYQMVNLTGGDDRTLNFDMTREEYINSLSPEERQNVEEAKQRNAEVQAANQFIAKLNATLKTVRADLAAAIPTKADVSADVASMKEAVNAKADEGLLWITYGDVLLAQADHLAAEDRKAGKAAMSDDDVVKTYQDSADAYKKGIDLDSAGAKPKLAEAAAGYNQMGVALSRESKASEATAAFDRAAKADPTKAGMFYRNAAIVLFNANQNDAALGAAEKAIATEPDGANAYWIKGQILMRWAKLDPKTRKMVPPPGCVEAYNKFLQLAPEDPKSQAVRETVAGLDKQVDTTYKAPAKK